MEKNGEMQNKKLVEYIGEFPGHSRHGNSELRNNEYIRVTDEQKRVIVEGISHMKPIQIQKMINAVDPENPVGCRTIQNAKYNYNKKERPYSYITNTADEVQVVLNELQRSPFIRSVIANDNGKPPGVLCYTNEQVELLKSTINLGAVIGIDRTFNLGACFVTSLVFQNSIRLDKTVQLIPLF